MSALGHKQTFALQNGMSALPQKRTCAAQLGMSALCQKRELMQCSKQDPLFNHFVGEREYLTDMGAQTVEAGTGPKNILSTFSFPITRVSSCIVQYMKSA